MSNDYEVLLDDFSKLRGRVERPRTFMEIAGYPHYENACSNILAFFLDPAEPHGLGTLVLDALTGVGNIATTDEGVGGNLSVEREVITNDSNRIDILIETDARIILIENKIYAGVQNPFDNYADYLDRRMPDDRAKHKFLLTLYQTDAGSRWGFMNLTYAKLVDQIRSMLGSYVSGADTRYLTLLLDFLNTLENLQEGTRMNPEFVKLLSERPDAAANFLTELLKFKDELRKKVRELRNLIDVTRYPNVEQEFYRERTGLYDDLIHNIRVSKELVVSVEASIFPQGWEIWISPRSGDYSALKDLLQSLEIPVKEDDGGFTHRDSYRYTYNENLDGIRSLLQDLIDRLAAGSA